jgi:hypothetical protein
MQKLSRIIIKYAYYYDPYYPYFTYIFDCTSFFMFRNYERQELVELFVSVTNKLF